MRVSFKEVTKMGMEKNIIQKLMSQSKDILSKESLIDPTPIFSLSFDFSRFLMIDNLLANTRKEIKLDRQKD